MSTTKVSRSNKLYALSNVFTTMEVVIDGEKRTLKSDVGLMMVFKTLKEAKRHQKEDSRILEITVS